MKLLGPLNKSFNYKQQLYMNRVKVRSYAKDTYIITNFTFLYINKAWLWPSRAEACSFLYYYYYYYYYYYTTSVLYFVWPSCYPFTESSMSSV